jgi:HEAT repeat protein
MRARRGRGVTLASVAIGAVVLVGAGIESKGLIVQQWLIYKLENGSAEERVVAATKLGNLHCARAIEGLGRLLGHADGNVRLSAAWALCQVAPGRPGSAVPFLERLVEHEVGVIRWKAVVVLGDMGPAAREAVPALATALQRDRRQTWIGEAIAKIQRETADAGKAR